MCIYRAANLPTVLAIDCEMCETKDPVTGGRNGQTLIRMSVVNGLNRDEVSFLSILVTQGHNVFLSLCSSLHPSLHLDILPLSLCLYSLGMRQVLIDTLVAPSWPITDMRTNIHGISADDLRPVNFTLRHAQAAMMSLCADNTVIIGHAVHHDLRSLKFNHRSGLPLTVWMLNCSELFLYHVDVW